MNKIFIFVLGATAGSLVTWKILDDKYKKLSNEEINAVREYYKSKAEVEEKEEKKTVKENSEKLEPEPEQENVKDVYKHVIKELKYENAAVSDQEGEYVKPYVIAPEEFGEFENYTTKSWTYYADLVLTDEMGEIVFDSERVLGDGLEHFGEYEDDSVYVRNENIECDFEILKYDKTFSEVNEEVL